MSNNGEIIDDTERAIQLSFPDLYGKGKKLTYVHCKANFFINHLNIYIYISIWIKRNNKYICQ